MLPNASNCCHLYRIFDLSNIIIEQGGRSISAQDTLRRFKAEFFQALAHPTRIAIIERLREGELSAGTLIERLGVEQANASQHLAVLRAKRILANRKAGNQMFYSVRDPLIIRVMDIMKQYFFTQLTEGQAMLDKIKAEAVDS